MLAIDCNSFFGVKADQRTDFGPKTLLAQMACAGVRAALTYSLRGVSFEHGEGNRETLEVCRRHPQLIPAATINLARYIDWEKDVEWCLAQGFRAFRMFPDQQAWAVDGEAFARFLVRVAPSGRPLIFNTVSVEHATRVARATADAGLPVVLVSGYYSNEAETIHLAKRYPHLHLDTARRSTPHIVRYMVGEIGLERVLFGTGAPQQCTQPSMNAVFVADLSPAETEQILSGNLLRLLGIDAATATGAVDDEPRYRGHPGPTIDIHAHLGPWRFIILTNKAETMLAYAKRHTIEKTIISSAMGIVYNMAEGNRQLKEWIDPHPELLGYVVTNANFVEESAAEMDHYYRFPNFVGAKIHAEYAQTPTSSARMAALFAEIAKRGRPVKIHNMGPDWMQGLQALARRHRDLQIVVAHGGGRDAGAFFKDDPNVHFEYCGSGSTRGVIPEHLRVVGAERLMFGTDQDLLDPAYAFGKYWDTGFTPAQAAQVYYTNARRLFGV